MKETAKSIAKQFESWRFAAKAYIHTLKFPTRRKLLSVDAADAQGKINGLTVVELLTIVNLTAQTHERVFLSAEGKTIAAWAEQIAPTTPTDLL